MVVYCGVCTLPPEYCEYGGQHKRCKGWLESTHPDLFAKLYSSEQVANEVGSLSLERQEELNQKVQRQVAKEEAKAERELAKKLSSKILIKRIERNRRKHVIVISGLDQINADMKKMSKTFASKFATGASVTKSPEGKDEIVIQGDVGEEVEAYLNDYLKKENLADIHIELIEDKKRKK